MRHIALAIVFVAIGSCNADAQAVVCPPYAFECYQKPVRPMTQQDRWNEFKAELQRDLAASEYRERAALHGLDRALGYTRFCNSITQAGC